MAYTVTIEWSVEDITNTVTDITEQQAEEFLIKIKSILTDRSIETGWDVIHQFLEEEGYDVD